MRINLWSTLAGAVALTLVAVTSDIGRAADVPPPGESACAALATAQFATVATLTTTYEAGSAAQPAHCVVRGAAARRTGADSKPYETRFELRLPTAWSGRFLYQGGGGNDVVVAPAVGRNTGSFPDTGLQRGFSGVTTDAGHQGGTAEFGIDPVARVDHAYAAHERTYTIAMAIQSQYYGRAPDHKYFVGCSGGGRQGMMFAQRYPAYFDGIAICAPAMSVSSGATIAAAWDTQTYLSAAPADANGQRVLSRAFSDADLALVARGITSACDAADGHTDGMVLRPDACRFDPNTLLCRGEKDANCLTATQVSALQRAFGGPRTSSGRALYVGQAWDPGIAAPGWRQWKLGSSQTATPNAANTTLMAGALAYEFVTPADPSLAIARFDFDRDPGRMQAFSQVYDTSRDATLAAFRKRGGKLLIFHGTADPIFSALESIDYYHRLSRNNGGRAATAQWARLFLVPGMNHCAGGPATDSFDGLGAIVDWVEKRIAHRRIGQSARGELRRPHASALRVSRVRSLLAVLGLRQRGARGANGTRGAAVGPGLAAGTGTGGRGRGAAAPAQPPVVLSRNGKEYTVTATNVRAGTEIKVATERPSLSLTLTELDRGSWVIFELPGFTTAASGTPQDSLNALRKTSETSYFKDKDALWVKVVSKGDPGNGAPGGGTSLEVSR